jgi:predicted acyl esterase
VLPPVPSVYGDGWRELWERRVTQAEPWALRWLEEQTYGPYWKHGSLREDYGAIEAATMLVTGWADGYTNIALRGMAGLRCPKRLLAGPWAHAAVETSSPGPNIDLVPEMVRWWDRWLKGVDNGVDREPPITLFVRRPTPPAAELRAYPGEWRFETGWPNDRSGALELEFAEATNIRGEGPDRVEIRGDVGWTAWISCAGGLPWGQPVDQRPDEAFSLVYDWAPLTDELEIFGHPKIRVNVRSSTPVAYLSAKLCDVHPDGTSQLVTRGLLNLTHRESREAPEPLEVDHDYEVAFELEVTSWAFETGHRIRLDLAGADWPNAWSPPLAGTLTIARGGSAITLPTVEGPPSVTERPSLPPPRREPKHHETSRGDEGEAVLWRVEHDLVARETRAITSYGGIGDADEHRPKTEERYEGVVGVSADDPGRAWVDARASNILYFPEATVSGQVHWRIESDAESYHVSIELDTAEDGEPRWSRTWQRSIPRNLQ